MSLTGFLSYSRVNWQQLPSKSTPWNATNLNIMDAGIKNNNDMISNLRDEVTQLNSNKEIIDISSYLRIPEETLSYVTRTKLFKMGGLVFIDIVCNIKEELKANTFLSIGNLSNIRTSFPIELNCIGINYSLGIFPIRGIIDGYSVKIYNTKTMDKETQILLSGFIMMV